MITYHLDYRDPPSGLGTITLENGDQILIQSRDEAKQVKDGIYSNIIVLKHDFEDYNSLQKDQIKVLRDFGVTHVYDPEEWGAATDKNGYMHILDFIRSRNL